MSGEGANAPEVQDQLYGTNSNSIQQELRMNEGSSSGIPTSAVEMADFGELDNVLSNFLNSDDYLANRLPSFTEIDYEETLDDDNIQHDQQETPSATSELTLPPFPGELEKSVQASNPGFHNFSQNNTEVFSQNVEVLHNVSQNVEVIHDVGQNAELFQNIVSQNNALPMQQQFDQFGYSNIGQNYEGSSSAAPLATQGTDVTGFNGGNFQMPTSNLTSQNRESSSSVQQERIQQPYPQGELEKSAQASNHGFHNFSQNNTEVFSQNVEVLHNVSQNVEVIYDAGQNAELLQNIVSQNNALPMQQQFDQFGYSNIGQNYEGSSSAAPLATRGTDVIGFNGGNFQMPTSNLTSQNRESSSSVQQERIQQPYPQGELEKSAQASNHGFHNFSQNNTEVFSQNVEVLHNVSQNVEVIYDAGQNAELFQNIVSQNNALPMQQQFDQSGYLNIGQNYGGPSSSAPVTTQGTAVTGFNRDNFQMSTSNLTSQNRESSSSVQPAPIQQPYPQMEMPQPAHTQQSTELQQGLQEIHLSQSPHAMGTTSLRRLKQRLRGLHPTRSLHQTRASPLRNVMMKMTHTSNSNLQQGVRGIHPTRNQNEMGYSSLSNVVQGLQRISPAQSQMKLTLGNKTNPAELQTRMQDIPSTQNPHEMGSSSLSNVMQGRQGNYPTQNWHEARSSSSSNIMQGLQAGIYPTHQNQQGIYPTQNQTRSSSSSNVMQGLQAGIYPTQNQQGIYPTQNQHETRSSSSSNVMQGLQAGIYPTQNQHETRSSTSSNVMALQQGIQGIYLTQNQHETGLSSSSNTMQGLQGIYPTQNQHEMGPSSSSYAMQGQLGIYPSQNPHELGASSRSNAMVRMDLSGNNQQPAVPQVGSSLYPVTAQGNYAPLGSPRSNEPMVYDPKFEQLGYPVDPFMRMYQFKGFKKP